MIKHAAHTFILTTAVFALIAIIGSFFTEKFPLLFLPLLFPLVNFIIVQKRYRTLTYREQEELKNVAGLCLGLYVISFAFVGFIYGFVVLTASYFIHSRIPLYYQKGGNILREKLIDNNIPFWRIREREKGYLIELKIYPIRETIYKKRVSFVVEEWDQDYTISLSRDLSLFGKDYRSNEIKAIKRAIPVVEEAVKIINKKDNPKSRLRLLSTNKRVRVAKCPHLKHILCQ